MSMSRSIALYTVAAAVFAIFGCLESNISSDVVWCISRFGVKLNGVKINSLFQPIEKIICFLWRTVVGLESIIELKFEILSWRIFFSDDTYNVPVWNWETSTTQIRVALKFCSRYKVIAFLQWIFYLRGMKSQSVSQCVTCCAESVNFTSFDFFNLSHDSIQSSRARKKSGFFSPLLAASPK